MSTCPGDRERLRGHGGRPARGTAAPAVLRRVDESHTLHVYLLHAPDFLGHADVVGLARDQRATVERGLRLKQAGNAILEQLGGRPIHPVNVRVGGFYRTPTPQELRPLAERLRQAREDALETVRWVAAFRLSRHRVRPRPARTA